VLSAGQRRVTFNPRYAGLNGTPVSFSVVNELVPTTNPGPYTLDLYTDNPIIGLRAVQSGVSASFSYGWLAACNPGARLGTGSEVPLRVTVLGNPVAGETVSVEVRGAEGQALSLSVIDALGHQVSEQSVGRAGVVERQTLRLGQTPAGVLLLRVSTSTQSQTLKLFKAE
uniref:T9SS type A sorting domain-containing protein n=1 Tax=Spirosoma spitsbergense TaxID=431554 RepID=UPI0012F7CBDF